MDDQPPPRSSTSTRRWVHRARVASNIAQTADTELVSLVDYLGSLPTRSHTRPTGPSGSRELNGRSSGCTVPIPVSVLRMANNASTLQNRRLRA
jgi:hypothetical protein